MISKLLLASALFAGAVLCEVAAPLAGYIRDNDKRWRPVFGIAGAFTIGQPVQDPPAPENATAVDIDGDEVVVGKRNVRLRLPRIVTSVEPMSAAWYVLKTSDGMLALRTEEGRESIYELPGFEE